ncbi:MAG: HD-GYP domain-containing protein [Nitrospirales bacterium]
MTRKKTIPIDAITIGMYLCGIDLPWMETPFLRHQFLIKTKGEIEKLKKAGVKTLTIDLSRGVDVAEGSDNHEASDSPAHNTLQDDLGLHTESETTPEARISQLPKTLRGKSLSHELSSTREVRQEMLESVRDILGSIATSGVVQASQVKEVTHSIIAQTLEHEEASIAIICSRECSPDLHEHSLSVGTLAVLLGRLVGYDESQLRILGTAALLHDVGLVRIPSSLLLPQNRKTVTDIEQYHSHTQLSIEILLESSEISDEVRKIVEEHHVLPDGTGYPKHIEAHTIGSMSQLLRVVDEYDELLTGQQGLPPMSGKDALGELLQRSKNNKLNLQLVSQFISQIGIYPIYSLVELNTGERGIVTAHSKENLLQPTVLLIQDATQQPFVDPVPINFSTIQDISSIPQIIKVLDPEHEGVQVEKILADWVTL